MFGGQRCTRCDRLRAACIGESVGRRHRKQDARERKPQQYVANPANRSHRWCSCGCLIREGRCVSATCASQPVNAAQIMSEIDRAARLKSPRGGPRGVPGRPR